MIRSYFFLYGLLIVLVSSPFSFLLAQSEPGSGDPNTVSKEKLEAIQKEIDSLRGEAARLSAQENSILATLAQHEVEYRMKTQEIQLLQLKQLQTETDIALLNSNVQQQESNLSRQKEALTRRLVEVYKLGELNYVKLMLQVESTADLLQSYHLITYLAKDDSRKVQMYRDSIRAVEQTRIRLEQEKRNVSLLRQDLELAHAALMKTKQEKVQLLTAIQDQKGMHLTALSDLRMAALQLQQLFTTADLPRPSISPQPSAQVSLLQMRGALDWPASGRVTREFGTYKHPKFGTATVSNGIEIAAPEGTEIRAVADGQVVFAEWFKGYGQCVILSHAGGFYTLYAHNSDMTVQRGQSVTKGQLIAHVGATGSLEGASLYFEIRQKDQPMNPLQWLRKR